MITNDLMTKSTLIIAWGWKVQEDIHSDVGILKGNRILIVFIMMNILGLVHRSKFIRLVTLSVVNFMSIILQPSLQSSKVERVAFMKGRIG